MESSSVHLQRFVERTAEDCHAPQPGLLTRQSMVLLEERAVSGILISTLRCSLSIACLLAQQVEGM